MAGRDSSATFDAGVFICRYVAKSGDRARALATERENFSDRAIDDPGPHARAPKTHAHYSRIVCPENVEAANFTLFYSVAFLVETPAHWKL